MAMLPPYQPPTLPPAPQGYFPPPPPPAPRKSNRAPLVIAGLVVGFLLLAFVGVLGSTNTPARSAAASTSTSSSTTTTTPPTTVSVHAEMAAWGARATPLLASLSGDMSDAQDAAQNYDLDDLHDACSSMVSHATSLRNTLPAPDVEMSEELDAAMRDFQQAGKACIRFAATLDTDEGNASAELMNSGSTHLTTAKVYLDRY